MNKFVNLKYKVQVIDEIKNKKSVFSLVNNYALVFLAEFIGTFFLLFFGCGCLNSALLQDWNEFIGSYMFGTVYGAAVQVFFIVSNGHLNPVVSFIFYIYGYISITFLILYIIAQLFGAIAGTALFSYLSKLEFSVIKISNDPHLCETVCSIDVTKALAWEFFGTLALGLFISSFIDPRCQDKRESYTFKLAIMVGVLTATMLPYTGGSLNPVRSFAPALINNHWDDQWIYWVGPITGGLMGAFIYHIFLYPKVDEKSEEPKTNEDQLETDAVRIL